MYTSTTTLGVSVLTYIHLHKHFYEIKLNQIHIFVPGAASHWRVSFCNDADKNIKLLNIKNYSI